ncbi:MAG: non-hydrolyzing UDP-N-acetylglucosamine 2-epimerase [Kiritimatiellia bacterium]
MIPAKKVLFVFGTRPEAIKMAPLVLELQKRAACFRPVICVTAQHRHMLDQVLEFFDIRPDYDLDIMKPGQTLTDITSAALKGVENVLLRERPDVLLVQGDTTTAFAAALAAFYQKIPVGHIEAGLRSGDKYSPYPEEINRIMISHLTDFHFAPTERARARLAGEGISAHVYITGNTVIDALLCGREKLKLRRPEEMTKRFPQIDMDRKIILVTGHRRESFGKEFDQICHALKIIAEKHDDVQIVYPVHLNPRVREPVNRILGNMPNICLIEPVDYESMIWLMNRCHLVLTDSGGIQEEAPALGKPVLVMRKVTERQEGIDAGTARLVGTDTEEIFHQTERLLCDETVYREMSHAVNPYGDGHASEKIADLLEQILN